MCIYFFRGLYSSLKTSSSNRFLFQVHKLRIMGLYVLRGIRHQDVTSRKTIPPRDGYVHHMRD